MTTFGDKDPEDAWDDGDPDDVLMALMERIVDSIEYDVGGRRRSRARDARRLVANLIDRVGDSARLDALAQRLEAAGG